MTSVRYLVISSSNPIHPPTPSRIRVHDKFFLLPNDKLPIKSQVNKPLLHTPTNTNKQTTSKLQVFLSQISSFPTPIPASARTADDVSLADKLGSSSDLRMGWGENGVNIPIRSFYVANCDIVIDYLPCGSTDEQRRPGEWGGGGGVECEGMDFVVNLLLFWHLIIARLSLTCDIDHFIFRHNSHPLQTPPPLTFMLANPVISLYSQASCWGKATLAASKNLADRRPFCDTEGYLPIWVGSTPSSREHAKIGQNGLLSLTPRELRYPERSLQPGRRDCSAAAPPFPSFFWGPKISS